MAKGQKTGGRKKGSRNKINRTEQLRKAALEGAQTPLEYMLEVMRDPKADVYRRDEMAKAVAPYLHARKAPSGQSGQYRADHDLYPS